MATSLISLNMGFQAAGHYLVVFVILRAPVHPSIYPSIHSSTQAPTHPSIHGIMANIHLPSQVLQPLLGIPP